jgi:hypothetical protein
MTISYLLAPTPKWVIIDNSGGVAGGAKLYTYRSLNKTEKKTVYQDPAGTIPWTNPILFDLNGTQGPFYWAVDSTDLADTYYLEAYDAQNNLLWTVDDFYPPGTGGGGNVTTFIPIVNYITNNQFINHIDDIAGVIAPNNSLPTNLVIAPSNHKGFTPATSSPTVGTNGVLGPDIRFVKSNTNAADNIFFPLFPLASYPLTGDVTPVDYVRYQCTNTPAGETYKAFQFPITQKVKNLSNQSMTCGIWAAVAATPTDINIYVRQYFGSGTAASAEVRTLIGTASLTTTWTWFPFNFAVPSVAGKSLGTPGQTTNDDAVYIQVEMPLGIPCDVYFIKPALFLGDIDPELEFDSYDQIDSINTTPRTGDVRPGYLVTAPGGWVAMNDGSIGNAGSGATTRANQDTFQLYKTIYDGVINLYAPVSGGRSGNATTDFIAGKTLTLPFALGRALAQAGSGLGLTARVLGQYLGNETVTLTGANLPFGTPFNATGSGSQTVQGGATTNAAASSLNAFTQGSSTAFDKMNPTSYMNFYIKL